MCMGDTKKSWLEGGKVRCFFFFVWRTNLKLKSFCGWQTQNKSGATIDTSEADDICLYERRLINAKVSRQDMDMVYDIYALMRMT